MLHFRGSLPNKIRLDQAQTSGIISKMLSRFTRYFALLTILFSLARPGLAVPRVEHVFIVSIDGGKPSVMQASEMPVLNKLIAEGAHTWEANTIFPSITLPSHTSMLTGVGAERHKITWNTWRPEKGIVTVPTIFSLAKQIGLSTAMFVGKEKFRQLLQTNSLDEFNYNRAESGEVVKMATGEEKVQREGTVFARVVARDAAAYILTNKPNLCFIHFADPDAAGHRFGWGSPEQIKALAETDTALGVIVQAITDARLADSSVLIVTSDHGGHARTHGSKDPEDMRIPWLAWGTGVKQGCSLAEPITTYDTAATALWLLQAPSPHGLDGHPVFSAFEQGNSADLSDPKGPMWNLAALSQPPKTYPADEFSTNGVKAVFFEGPSFRGRPTRVFAWIGLPKVPPGRKVPGMVLVHGGGGTAFAQWVSRWNSYGYAAIAMDTCGAVPRGTYGHWERQSNGGPPGWGGWDQIDWPREEQWTYHAVADAVLAHSLLRSLPEVDPRRIGVTGISWGGYLTCLIAGVDHRFAFAAPVYGCGFTDEHNFAGSVKALGPEASERWMRWWDPKMYLCDANLPMLWVTGSNDFAYTPNALQKSYRLAPGPRTLCVRLRMPHGHGEGERPKEIQVFADSLLKRGAPLPKITGQGRKGDQVWATFKSKVPLLKAELNFTRDTGNWKERRWESVPAKISRGKLTASLPSDARVYYLNLFDDRSCVVSTEHEEL